MSETFTWSSTYRSTSSLANFQEIDWFTLIRWLGLEATSGRMTELSPCAWRFGFYSSAFQASMVVMSSDIVSLSFKTTVVRSRLGISSVFLQKKIRQKRFLGWRRVLSNVLTEVSHVVKNLSSVERHFRSRGQNNSVVFKTKRINKQFWNSGSRYSSQDNIEWIWSISQGEWEKAQLGFQRQKTIYATGKWWFNWINLLSKINQNWPIHQ